MTTSDIVPFSIYFSENIPFFLRDGSGYCIDSAWVVGLAGHVPAEHCSYQGEGQDHKQTDAGDCNLKTSQISVNLSCCRIAFFQTHDTKAGQDFMPNL